MQAGILVIDKKSLEVFWDAKTGLKLSSASVELDLFGLLGYGFITTPHAFL